MDAVENAPNLQSATSAAPSAAVVTPIATAIPASHSAKGAARCIANYQHYLSSIKGPRSSCTAHAASRPSTNSAAQGNVHPQDQPILNTKYHQSSNYSTRLNRCGTYRQHFRTPSSFQSGFPRDMPRSIHATAKLQRKKPTPRTLQHPIPLGQRSQCKRGKSHLQRPHPSAAVQT